jgi:hypothetical protein
MSTSLAGSCFSSETALPSWNFEDEAEQSNGRPGRLSNGRSKRTCELTSSVVPRGTSFHRLVELGFPPIAVDPAWLSCCCGFFPSPAELRAVNPKCGAKSKADISRFRRRDLRGRFEIRCQACSASSNVLASFRSRVSNPSVNQPYTGASSSRACCGFRWWRQRRARLIAARSSQDLACC